MKKIVMVVIAAAALLGLGYYFAQSSFGTGTPTAANGAGAGGSHDLVDAHGHAQGEALARADTANMHPEKDGAQFKASGPQKAADDGTSNAHGNSISFEGSNLPNADRLAREAREREAAKKAQAERDLKFAPLEDNSDVVGAAYFPHGDSPKHKKIAAKADHINDDLLIMEGRSEDRIVTAGAGK